MSEYSSADSARPPTNRRLLSADDDAEVDEDAISVTQCAGGQPGLGDWSGITPGKIIAMRKASDSFATMKVRNK